MAKVLAPVVGIIAVGIGTIFGLEQAQVETVEQALLQIVVAATTAYGVYKMIKKKK